MGGAMGRQWRLRAQADAFSPRFWSNSRFVPSCPQVILADRFSRWHGMLTRWGCFQFRNQIPWKQLRLPNFVAVSLLSLHCSTLQSRPCKEQVKHIHKKGEGTIITINQLHETGRFHIWNMEGSLYWLTDWLTNHMEQTPFRGAYSYLAPQEFLSC